LRLQVDKVIGFSPGSAISANVHIHLMQRREYAFHVYIMLSARLSPFSKPMSLYNHAGSVGGA
jgi:hypothetical protein